MAKIALCAYCNTAVILKSWPGAVNDQPGAPPDQLGDEVVGQDGPPNVETGEIKVVPDFTLCRCGATMAYYDDEDIAMVTPTCVVLGCDTTLLTNVIAAAPTRSTPKEVRFYRIDVPGTRTELIDW